MAVVAGWRMRVYWRRRNFSTNHRLDADHPVTISRVGGINVSKIKILLLTVLCSTALYIVWVRESLISLLSVTNPGQKPERLVYKRLGSAWRLGEVLKMK
jgi:hypothetical protein